MDISKITSIIELKALAHDQLVLRNNAQENLQTLYNRINELQSENIEKKSEDKEEDKSE